MVDCLLIGPLNIVCYKDIFPEVVRGKINIGYNMVSRFISDDKVFNNIHWFTSLTVCDKGYIELKSDTALEIYSKYDHMDVMNIDRLEDIPDYDGIMGVPLSFIRKWNRNQFDIVGIAADWTGISGGIQGYRTLTVDGNMKYVRILIRKK